MAKNYFGKNSANAMMQLVKEADATKIDKTSIVNSLDSEDATGVLSAAQGKALADALAAQKSELEGRIDEVAGADGLDKKLDVDKVGAANGVASLDANGLVPSDQLPSYVDDLIVV